jgi:cytoskeletal protein RodZ
LPGGIFSRAFVRSYAIEVGLDPEATLQEFIAQFPHDSVTAGHPASDQIEDNEALESQRRIASAFLRLVLVSLPIVGILMYYSSGREVPSAEVAREIGSEPAIESAGEPPPSVQTLTEPFAPAASRATRTASIPAVAPAARTDLLVVEITAEGPCWVSATVDGSQAIQRELRAGERQTLSVRREIVLTAGDAAALAVTLNGESARPLGRPGQVVTRRLNLSNFRDYLVTP